MSRVHPTVRQVLLSMAATSATAGVLVALRAWWIAPAVAAVVLSPFLQWRPVPSRLTRALPGTLRLTLVLTFAAVWFSGPVPVLAAASGWLLAVFGTLLAALAAVFALAPATFAPGRTLLPALLGLLVVAGADPAPPGFGRSLVPAFEAAGHNGFADAYLAIAALVVAASWAATLSDGGPSWRGRRLLLLAGSALIAAAMAAGGAFGLPLAQPHVERAFVAAFEQPATGLSGESVLGEFGELALSRRRVLDLRASPDAGAHWLLRSEVLTRFDGRRWTTGPPPAARARLLVPGPAPAAVPPLLADIGPWFPLREARGDPAGQLRITQHALDSWPLLVPGAVSALTADAAYLDLDPLRLVRRSPGTRLSLYGAQLTTRPPAGELPEADAAAALALPSRVDPRTRALAARLGDAAEASGRVERTLRHLRTQYAYTLSPGPFRPGGDPVAEFLFEKKRGYCEYFASAAVLLLRLQGVPARFVKGLSVGPQADYGGGLFVVRDSDAHAWVDAWVDGDWREVDPTPPGSLAATRPAPGALESAFERLRAAAAEAWARLAGPGIVSLARWLGRGLAAAALSLLRSPPRLAALLLLAASPWLVRRCRRRLRAGRARRAARQALGVPPELMAAIEDLERFWRRIGRERPAARGLLEHAEGLVAARPAPAPADLLHQGRALVELYYAARFGDRPAGPAAVALLREGLREAAISRTRPGPRS